MIKYTNDLVINDIKVRYNLIFDLGYCPKSWNYGLIKPTYKSWSKDDPLNYLGITLIRNNFYQILRRAYCVVLYKSIKRNLDKNLMPKAQADLRE